MTKPMLARWPTAAEAELEAARAGHHVPATDRQDRRCWSCIKCGGTIPKKRTAVTRETPGGYIPYFDGKCPHCGYNAYKEGKRAWRGWQ